MLSLNPTDAEIGAPSPGLLDRARAGDAEAFCELCRACETRVLRQAVALCGDPALAEDLAQDTLVEAWRSLRRFNGRCRFFTWLCSILLNRYRNTLRKKRPVPFSAFPKPAQNEFETGVGQWLNPDASPDDAAQHHERAVLVRQCIQALPHKHQQVIHLRFYVDDSLAGIAAALGCSLGTVKSRLFHALEKLRVMSALREQHADGRQKPGIL